MEHDIVDRYASMINDEVQRYKSEMLDYFHVEELSSDSTETQPQHLYTTSLAQTAYDIEEYDENSFVRPERNERPDGSSTGAHRTPLNNTPFNNNDDLFPPAPAFLTEDSSSEEILFSRSFEMPSNLVHSIMFK